MSTSPETQNSTPAATLLAESQTAEHLRAFLAGRDVACPGCAYNLRDLVGSRCPECGDEVVLRVGLAEPRQAAMIAGLIGLAAGAGMNGLLLGYLLIRRYIVGDRFGPEARFLIINAAGFLVEGVSLALWMRYWGAIRRRDRRAKILLVCGCWLLTLINLFVFSLLIT